MVYIFGLKQATKMGLSLLHPPLAATSIRVNVTEFWKITLMGAFCTLALKTS